MNTDFKRQWVEFCSVIKQRRLTRNDMKQKLVWIGLCLGLLACSIGNGLIATSTPIPLFVPTVTQGTATGGTATPNPLPGVNTPTFPAVPPTAIEPTFTPWASNSPVGHIAFVCFIDGFDNICLMNGDGSNVQRLTTTMATDFYPSLSPDGL